MDQNAVVERIAPEVFVVTLKPILRIENGEEDPSLAVSALDAMYKKRSVAIVGTWFRNRGKCILDW